LAAIKATKKATPDESEKGVPLAPSAKDLKPWYSERTREQPAVEEVQDEKRCVCVSIHEIGLNLLTPIQENETNPENMFTIH
jgi:hypothetical protein